VRVARDQIAKGDGKLVTTTFYDPLGRVRLVDNGVSRVQKAYRFGSAVSYELVSNPFAAATSGQAGTETTMGWTLATRDSVGRVVSTQHYAGTNPPGTAGNLTVPPAVASNPPATWGSNIVTTGTVTTVYNGSSTSISDEAFNTHTNTVDGL